MILKQTKSTIITLDDNCVKKEYIRDFKGYSAKLLFENEVGALKLLKGEKGFQQIKEAQYPILFTEYCGKPQLMIDETDEIQITNIIKVLDERNILHRDIIPSNLMYLNGITLIDFAWAYYPGCQIKGINDCPRNIGGKFKVENFDNKKSFERVIRYLNDNNRH